MEIVLVRHGHAVDEAPGLDDPGRWLSGKGRKVTRRVARWLAAKKKRRPAAIWTSPLVRAVQTAEILASALELTDGVTVRAELAAGRAPTDLLELLSRQTAPAVLLEGASEAVAQAEELGTLAIVGHEPQLSQIARVLLGEPSFPELKKSGLVALSWDGIGAAHLRFVLDPKGLTVQSAYKVEPPVGIEPA